MAALFKYDRLVKHVTCFIEPPQTYHRDQEICTEYFSLRIPKAADMSEIVLMSFRVEVHFKASGEIGIYIAPKNDAFTQSIQFYQPKFSVKIVDQLEGKSNKTQSKERDCFCYSDSSIKFDGMISREDIRAESNCYVKNGCLQIIVVFFQQNRVSNISTLGWSSSAARDLFNKVINESDPKNMVILRTSDGGEFRAFKSLLSQFSPVFQSMFVIDMIEKTTGIVNVQEFSGAALREFLSFVCLDESLLLHEVDMELYRMADVYQVPKLKEVCVKSMKQRIDKENVIEILQFAADTGEDELFDACFIKLPCYYYSKRLQDIIEKLSNELQNRVLKSLLDAQSNNDVFCKVTGKIAK